MEQPEAWPDDEESLSHTGKTMSIVPSRSAVSACMDLIKEVSTLTHIGKAEGSSPFRQIILLREAVALLALIEPDLDTLLGRFGLGAVEYKIRAAVSVDINESARMRISEGASLSGMLQGRI